MELSFKTPLPFCVCKAGGNVDTVGTRIALFDNMTGPAMRMVSSLDNLINGFNMVQSASRDIGDSMPFDGMRQHIDLSTVAAERMNNTFNMIDESIYNNEKQQNRFNNEIKSGGKFADELGGKIGKIAGMLGVAFGARSVFNFFKESIEMTNQSIQAEQQLANVLANQGASEADFLAIRRQAANIQSAGMYDNDSMIGGAAELATYIKDAEALKSMMGTLTNYAAGMSGGMAVSYQQMVDYATQLGKALDGTYDGLKKKGFELTEAQKKIIETGSDMEKALVIDEVINQSWANLYEQMSNTPIGKIEQVHNAIGDIREQLGERLYPVILQVTDTIQQNLPQIEQLLNGLVPVIRFIINLIGQIISVASRVYNFFAENWSLIGPIINTVALAFIAYKAAVLLAEGAQWLLNAATYAFPGTWIVLIIIAIIAALATLWDNCEGFRDFITDMWSRIMKALVRVYNEYFVPVVNGIIFAQNEIMTATTDFAKGMVNTFFNMAIGIIDTFDIVIYGMKGIADTYNSIASVLGLGTINFDFKNLKQGLVLTRDSYIASIDKYREDQSWKPVSPLNLEAWDAAIDKVATDWNNFRFGDLFNDLFGQFQDVLDENGISYDPSIFDGIGQLADIADDTANIAGNTQAIANISEENLKYLRDIAEREVLNRFTSVEVNFGDINNNVSSDMDLDGIVYYIVDGTREALGEVSEGVHM